MGTELAPRSCRGRGPCGASWGEGQGSRGGEAGGGAHPQGRQVDVVQAAGGGWVAHGRRRAAYAPARSLRCRRRRFSPIGGPGGRAPPRLPQRPGRGRASGRTDPAADRRSRPRACNPSRRQPCARAERTVTRAHRAPPPARRRHLRAGARERAAGARQAEPRGSPAWKKRAHPLVRVRTHLPFLFPFLLLLLLLLFASSPLIPPLIFLFDSFPSLLSFVCPAANQTTHLSICGGREAGPNPLYY